MGWNSQWSANPSSAARQTRSRSSAVAVRSSRPLGPGRRLRLVRERALHLQRVTDELVAACLVDAPGQVVPLGEDPSRERVRRGPFAGPCLQRAGQRVAGLDTRLGQQAHVDPVARPLAALVQVAVPDEAAVRSYGDPHVLLGVESGLLEPVLDHAPRSRRRPPEPLSVLVQERGDRLRLVRPRGAQLDATAPSLDWPGGDDLVRTRRARPGAACPVDELADCARVAVERDGATVLNYGPVGGYGPLREWVAERHGVTTRAGARHERIAAGPVPALRAPGRAGLAGARRGPDLRPRAPHRRPSRGRARRPSRWTTRASIPTGSSSRPPSCTRSRPSRTRAAARSRSSGAAGWPSWPATGACSCSRTTPTPSSATRASRCRASTSSRGARASSTRSRSRRSSRPGCGSAT